MQAFSEIVWFKNEVGDNILENLRFAIVDEL